MNSSLRDQLLKAGLVTENKVRQASQGDEQRRKQLKNRGKSVLGTPRAGPAQQVQAEIFARDQELNRRQQDKAQRKALLAQIEQLIEQARLPRLESEDYYGFVEGGKIRRVAVDAERRARISRGELAVVRYKGHHEVVPEEVAQRIRARDERAVISCDDKKDTAAADDPYKDFVVPDDLTW